MHCLSDDGSKLLLLLPSIGVKVLDLTKASTDEEAEKHSFVLGGGNNSGDNDGDNDNSTRGVQFMCLSSLGSYILTWEKPKSKPSGSESGGSEKTQTQTQPNLKIWSSVSGRFLHGFTMRTCKRYQWPPVRWTHDEQFAFHQVANQLNVYNGHDFATASTGNTTEKDAIDGNVNVRYIDQIRCKGMTSFSLPTKSSAQLVSSQSSSSSKKKYLLSTFIGETKGKPARVSLLRYPDRLGTADNPSSGAVLVSKSFYQAEECTTQWSPQGDAALILTTTSVDSSGESYYGSTNLYLLLSDVKTRGIDGEALSVPLPSANATNNGGGPVLDVAWMPNPDKPSSFAVISGKMPALTSLHHGTTAEPTFLLGNAHRNTIVWSTHGRFLTLGGFGNLAGGMDFIDRNKMKPMTQYHPATGADLGANGNTASCAVGYGWSPDSRYFMVSTTSPRMNVDNGVALYKYNGLEIRDEMVVSWDNSAFLPNLLLAAEFVPAKRDAYPDRPQSPPPKKRVDGDTSAATAGGGGGKSIGGAASGPGSGAGGNGNKTTGAYIPPAGRYVPPNARKSGGTSLADRMRREREGSSVGVTKVAPRGAVVGANPKKGPVGMTTNVDGGKSKSALKKERQRLAKKKAEEEAKAEAERKAVEEKERAAAAAADPVKRSKKLKKIIKQIDELKAKDPSTLNEDQKKKLATEESIREELESLKL